LLTQVVLVLGYTRLNLVESVLEGTVHGAWKISWNAVMPIFLGQSAQEMAEQNWSAVTMVYYHDGNHTVYTGWFDCLRLLS
jgi:hypothetical protein